MSTTCSTVQLEAKQGRKRKTAQVSFGKQKCHYHANTHVGLMRLPHLAFAACRLMLKSTNSMLETPSANYVHTELSMLFGASGVCNCSRKIMLRKNANDCFSSSGAFAEISFRRRGGRWEGDDPSVNIKSLEAAAKIMKIN